MSGGPVVIEVTRGPVVESRHEGIAAVARPDGTLVASWGDIDAAILPRSANKPIQAMACDQWHKRTKVGCSRRSICNARAKGQRASYNLGLPSNPCALRARW